MVETPTIDVAVINWNTAAAAIVSAGGYLRSGGVHPRVVIADNNSSAQDQSLLRSRLPPGAELLSMETNLGYGGAANRALAAGDAELVCVSNADVVPRSDMLSRLSEAVQANRGVGLASPYFEEGGSGYHASLPTRGVLLVRSFIGSFQAHKAVDVRSDEVARVGQPAGACILLRRSTWHELGGFDAGFFLWYEDVDLAKRLCDTGHYNVVVGSARARHAGGEAFGRLDRRAQQAIRLRSLRRYITKHHPELLPLARPLLALAWLTRVRTLPPT